MRNPVIDHGTVASIQTVFSRSRLSHQGWSHRQLEGRIDSRNVWRNDARGVVDIFKDRRAQSVTKVNVWLLVDASGSMGEGGGYDGRKPTKSTHAQDLVATMAEAFKRISTVRLHVVQHNTARSGYGVDIYRIYDRGRVNKITEMHDNVGGGNADGFALQWVGEQALKDARSDERTVIIVISDGLPSAHADNATNYDLISFSHTVSEELRRKGASVLCVAVEAGAMAGHAVSMYGRDNVLPFQGNSVSAWADLARGFGSLLGVALR